MANFQYVTTNEQLRRVAARLGEMPKGADTVALDTETTGLDPLELGARLLLVQVGIPGLTWVINACQCDLGILKPVLEDGRLCVLQNAKFDYKWLRIHAGIRLPRMYDTMIAELVLIAGQFDNIRQRRGQTSLKALAKKHLGIEMSKKARKDFINYQGDQFGQALIEYAAEDIPHLFPIKEAQVPELKSGGLIETVTIEFRVLPVVGDMELNGLGIDRGRYAAVIEEAKASRERAEAEVQEIMRGGRVMQRNLFGDVTLNLRAPEQVRGMLMAFGIVVESTEEKELRKLDHPLARALLTWREYEKQVSTYGEPVLEKVHPATGRIHAEFQQLGSDAGRFSCEKPNLQQVPATEQFRGCFVPSAGNVHVVGDWAQFELRILAQFSRDPSMLEAFQAGLDMHTDTAARMYGIPYDQVAKKGPERQSAKILNFALCYGMAAESLALALQNEGVECNTEQAKERTERWAAARAQAWRWLQDAGRRALTQGETRTLAGRRRLMLRPDAGPNRRSQMGAIERKGKNSPIQGSNADMLKVTMRMVADELAQAGLGQKLGEGMVACVHDEIVLEVPADRGEEARDILARCMTAGGERYLTEVPVKAEVGIAPCWLK